MLSGKLRVAGGGPEEVVISFHPAFKVSCSAPACTPSPLFVLSELHC